MRRSSQRGAIAVGLGWIGVLAGGLFAAARADDSPKDGDPAIDHPIIVVAAASIDRLLERTTTLLEVSGRDASPESIQKMFSVAQLVVQLDGDSTDRWPCRFEIAMPVDLRSRCLRTPADGAAGQRYPEWRLS